MKPQNINNFIVIVLVTLISSSFMGCDSDAKTSYKLTVNYINNTDRGVSATITHSQNKKTLVIPAKGYESYISQYYVAGDGFFESFRSVALDFDDGKQVIYSITDVDTNKETDLCNPSNYTKINDYEYSISVTEDHYKEAN